MHPDDPTGTEPDDEEQRRRRQQRREDTADGGPDVGDVAEVATGGCSALSGCGSFGRSGGATRAGAAGGGVGGGRRGSGCDGCDICDGCDFPLVMRLSPLLLLAAALVPELGGGPLVRALIRGYRRWLTRFTPACPSTPSCSAFALASVESLGPRRGLVAAAHRVRACGRPAVDENGRAGERRSNR